MNKIHDHTNCPACTANLSGEENHCPFCGYRLVFDNNSESVNEGEATPEIVPDETANVSEIAIIEDHSDIIHENNLEKEPYHAPEILKTEEENIIKTSQEDEKSIYSDDNLINDENPESEDSFKEVENRTENEDEAFNEDISLLNDDEAEIEEKKYKKSKILVSIVLAVVIILIAFGTLTILHYYNKVDVFFLPDCKNNTSKVTQQVVSIEKNYYFCYSTGKINKKYIIVFSKVFNLNDAGNDEALATKIYKKQLEEAMPDDAGKLPTTICRKYKSPVVAYTEKDKLIKKYLKQKYSFRFIEVKK